MGRSIIAAIAFSQLTALALLVSSADARDFESASIIRLQARQDAVVTYSGSLACVNTESNTGEACTLTFTDSGSGRILNLAGDRNLAMRLYQDGQRSVAITGTVRGSYLAVDRITAI